MLPPRATLKTSVARGRLTFRPRKKNLFTPSRETKHAHNKTRLQVAKEKTKPQNKTQFSKIKAHLKLSCESVDQGRGGLEGTVRPSQLRV